MSKEAQASVDAFFALPGDGAPSPLAARTREAAPRAAVNDRPFSVFVGEDLAAAVAVADAMAIAANGISANGGSDEDAVNAALALAARMRAAVRAGMVDHAAKLFVTHHRSARNVRLPNLMSRMKVEPRAAIAAAETTGLPDLGGSTGSDAEDKLGWFREDPLANEHHEHWHLVYVRFDGDNFAVRPRHGELFFYMHQQMLARYDAERLAAGLPRVVPYDDYTIGLGEGYRPGGLVIGETSFLERQANARWQPIAAIGNYSPADHALRRDRLREAIARRKLEVPGGPSVILDGMEGSNILGHTDESGGKSVSGPGFNSFFGNHHGFGHVLTAALSDPARLEGGVMYHPAAAIRDPFFWRWHKHVDDLNFEYQEGLQPHTFEAAPSVAFGGGDDAGLAIVDSAGLSQAGEALGRSTESIFEGLLGGSLFDRDAARGRVVVGQASDGSEVAIELHDTIKTEMRRGVFQLNTAQVAEEEPRFGYPYLWHPSYHFAVRLRSTGSGAQLVTVRLFLCPAYDVAGAKDASINDRRLWIELDKFEARLAAGESKVLTRADTLSTIVRRPVTPILANPDVVRDVHFEGQGETHPDASACECGWPYHLLYPRGNKQGMRFALLTIVTKDDRLARQGQCGSMSFCAVNDEYPDAKPMGYPFDRPLAKPMAALVAENPSLSMRFITIREQ